MYSYIDVLLSHLMLNSEIDRKRNPTHKINYLFVNFIL